MTCRGCSRTDHPLYGFLVNTPEEAFDQSLSKFWNEGLDIYRSSQQGGLHRPAQANGGYSLRQEPQHLKWQTPMMRRKYSQDYRTIYNPAPDYSNRPRTSSDPAATYKRRMILAHREHWKHVFSNKTCLVCLQGVPNYVLSCKHAYCAACVQELGEPSDLVDCAWRITRCLLCGETVREQQGQLFALKPRCAGVRILTLDGGGVRGIVELAIIAKLEESIPLRLPFGYFFDLVVGTSTGEFRVIPKSAASFGSIHHFQIVVASTTN